MLRIGDFRISDVPVSAASGIMVKTGTASEFQAASGVTRLRILSGLFFSMQPKAIASMIAMLHYATVIRIKG